jgi:hypothetical protein
MKTLVPGIIVGLLLLVPSLLLPLRLDVVEEFSKIIENRELAPFPELASASDLLLQDWYSKLDSFLSDRYPIRDLAIPAKANLDYFVLRKSEMNGVDRGRRGWLFLHSSLNLGYSNPDDALDAVRRIQTSLRDYVASRDESGARLLIAVTPDKASVYPENLSPHSRRDYDRFLPARQLLREVIIETDGLEAIDIWTLYAHLKSEPDRTDGPVYYPRDTHHTRAASMEMVKAVLNELTDGSAWPGPATTPTGNFYERVADLSKLAALVNFSDLVETRSTPTRSATTYSLRLIDGEELDPEEAADWINTWREPVRALTRSGEDPLIGGRTLILHDSFLAGARDILASHFEDVRFQHWRRTTPCEFQQALVDYDRVVLEIVERRAAARSGFLKLLSECPDIDGEAGADSK